jgi:hypothetical protein
VHCKKSFSIFLSPAGMSLTNLSLAGNNDVIYKLFPPRESLVSDIPAGNGNIEKLFYSVPDQICMSQVVVLPSCWVGAYPLNTCHCFMDDCLQTVRSVRMSSATI